MLLPGYSAVSFATATPCQIRLCAVLVGLPSQLTGPCRSNHRAFKLLTSAGFCIFSH